MIRLTEKHIAKLAIITDTAPEKMTELAAMGLLDPMRAIDIMARYDWKLLKHRGGHTARQRLLAIAEEYDLPEDKIRKAIYASDPVVYYCTKCGRPAEKLELKHNNGLCDRCMAKTIEL